jgi:hypothetical protein
VKPLQGLGAPVAIISTVIQASSSIMMVFCPGQALIRLFQRFLLRRPLKDRIDKLDLLHAHFGPPW